MCVEMKQMLGEKILRAEKRSCNMEEAHFLRTGKTKGEVINDMEESWVVARELASVVPD